MAHLPKFDLLLEVKDVRSDDTGVRFRSIGSTGAADRDGESIEPAGWTFPKATIPLFFGHAGYRSAENWIGFVERAATESDSLILDNWIPKVRHNEVGEKMADFLGLGLPIPGSVGFDPISWTNRDGSKGQRGRGEPFPGPQVGRRYTGQELLEFSLVPVPSNTDSRVLALSKALLALEEGGGTGAAGVRALVRLLAGEHTDRQPAAPRSGLEKLCADLGIPIRASRSGLLDLQRLADVRDQLTEIVESANRADET